MDPVIVVSTFAAVASGLAVFRVVSQHREMRRTVRIVSRRRRPEDIVALRHLRQAADALRELR